MHFSEGHERSIVKAVTFRACILGSDLAIILFVTHKFDEAIGLIVLTNLSSTLVYFLHERLWNRIHWGKKELNEQPHLQESHPEQTS